MMRLECDRALEALLRNEGIPRHCCFPIHLIVSSFFAYSKNRIDYSFFVYKGLKALHTFPRERNFLAGLHRFRACSSSGTIEISTPFSPNRDILLTELLQEKSEGLN